MSVTSVETETTVEPAERARWRTAAMWIALVLAGIFLLLSTFAVWVNRVALNTNEFASTTSQLLANDEIRRAVATRAVDELYASVDVQAELEGQLPNDFKSLSGPAAAGLRQASYEIVDRALEQPRFQRLFTAAVRESHATLVQVLEGGGSRVSTENGEVILNMRAILLEAADRIGLSEQAQSKIPADAGRIVVLRSDQLKTAQDGFQLLKTLAWLLPILTVVMFGIAVWLARDRRRGVRGIGIVLTVVGALGLVASRLTGNYVVDHLIATEDNRKAGSAAWDILTVLMRSTFRWMIVVGLLFLLAAWIAGRGRRAVAARRALAPAVQNRTWAYVVLVIAFVVLLVTSPVMDFARLLVILVLVALGVAWIEITRAQSLREFPDATSPTHDADARTLVSDWWDERREQRSAHKAPAAPADVTSQLARLSELHAQGKLSDEEYAAAKTHVLSGK
jgi:hypothetical protein